MQVIHLPISFIVSDMHSDSSLKNFMDECIRMKSFRHPNILGLLGMCLDSPDMVPSVVLPFMANGNLKNYLQQSRGYSKVHTYPLVSRISILQELEAMPYHKFS